MLVISLQNKRDRLLLPMMVCTFSSLINVTEQYQLSQSALSLVEGISASIEKSVPSLTEQTQNTIDSLGKSVTQLSL